MLSTRGQLNPSGPIKVVAARGSGFSYTGGQTVTRIDNKDVTPPRHRGDRRAACPTADAWISPMLARAPSSDGSLDDRERETEYAINGEPTGQEHQAPS